MRSSSDVQDVGFLEVPATGLQLGEQERVAVERVLASGMLAQGPEVAAFESEFAVHVGGRPCVAVNSGTSALLLAYLHGNYRLNVAYWGIVLLGHETIIGAW